MKTTMYMTHDRIALPTLIHVILLLPCKTFLFYFKYIIHIIQSHIFINIVVMFYTTLKQQHILDYKILLTDIVYNVRNLSVQA